MCGGYLLLSSHPFLPHLCLKSSRQTFIPSHRRYSNDVSESRASEVSQDATDLRKQLQYRYPLDLIHDSPENEEVDSNDISAFVVYNNTQESTLQDPSPGESSLPAQARLPNEEEAM